MPEQLEYVPSAADGVRPVTQQSEQPLAPGVGDAPWHDGDVCAEVGGDSRGEQRAGTACRLDDDDQAGERGDDALAGDEAPGLGRVEPGRKLRDRCATCEDVPLQVFLLDVVGKGNLGAGGHHGDVVPAGV